MKPLLILLLCCLAVGVHSTSDEKKNQVFQEFLRGAFSDELFTCSMRHKLYYHPECEMRSTMLYNRMQEKPLTDYNAHRYRTSCMRIDRCFFPMSCSPDKETAIVGYELEKFCGLEVFTKSVFAECAKKLEERDSECYKKWAPYPEVTVRNYREEDETKEAKRIKEYCNRYFGENLCMEKEVMETCGEEDWNTLRSHLMNINQWFMDCHLPYRTRPNKFGPLEPEATF
uniref:DUF19 domain-containing protein n=1 Tax=Caenorhabditis tropicalis TaxID=1561998 RepID=A0A1I7UJB3_9PELO